MVAYGTLFAAYRQYPLIGKSDIRLSPLLMILTQKLFFVKNIRILFALTKTFSI